MCKEPYNPALFSNTQGLDCQEYYSHSSEKWKCVSSNRIKHFEGSEKACHVTGQFGEIFKLLETFPLDLGQRVGEALPDSRYDKLIYAQIYSYNRDDNQMECDNLPNNKDKTTDIYIVFNCGIILNPELIWDPILNTYFSELYQYCLSYYREVNKVIISGHSMGGVLALRFGYYLNQQDNLYFQRNCLVIASGPYCFLRQTDIDRSSNSFNQLVNGLKNNHPTLLSLLQLTPSLLEKVQQYADKITVLAPTENVFKSLKPEVVNFLTKPSNSNLLEDLLSYHIVSNTAVNGQSHKPWVAVRELLMTPAHADALSSVVSSGSTANGNTGILPTAGLGVPGGTASYQPSSFFDRSFGRWPIVISIITILCAIYGSIISHI